MGTRISVIIALFNKRDTVIRAVSSALNQEPPPDEVIVVDDGSTDNGHEMVLTLNDGRVRLIRQNNGGPSSARNRGVAESKNEMLAFLDADDEWLPGHLRSLEALLSVFPDAGLWSTGFSYSNNPLPFAQETDSLPRIHSIDEYLEAQLSGKSIVCTSTALARKSELMKAGGFLVGHNHGEDQALWLKIAMEKPVATCRAVTAIYHLSPDTLSKKLVTGEDACMLTISRIIEERKGLDESLAANLREFRYRFALGHALGALENRNPAVAYKFLDIAKGTKRFARKRRVISALWFLDSAFPGFAIKVVSTRKLLRRIKG